MVGRGDSNPRPYRVKVQLTNTLNNLESDGGPPKHAEIRVRPSFNGTESGTEFPGRCLYVLCEAGRLDFSFGKDEGQNASECQHDGKG